MNILFFKLKTINIFKSISRYKFHKRQEHLNNYKAIQDMSSSSRRLPYKGDIEEGSPQNSQGTKSAEERLALLGQLNSYYICCYQGTSIFPKKMQNFSSKSIFTRNHFSFSTDNGLKRRKGRGTLIDTLKFPFEERSEAHNSLIRGISELIYFKKTTDVLQKDKISIFGVVGGPGSGKTELLYDIRATYDSIQNPNDIGDYLKRIQSAQLNIQKVIVLFASYNGTGTYDDFDDLDLFGNLIVRFMRDYFKDLSIQQKFKEWLKEEEEKPGYIRTTTKLDHFTRWIRKELYPNLDQKDVAVIMCIDEVLKVRNRNKKNFETLLDKVGDIELDHLNMDCLTLPIISSLDLWELQNSIESESGRRFIGLHVKPLERSSVEEHIEKHLLGEFHVKDEKIKQLIKDHILNICKDYKFHPRNVESILIHSHNEKKYGTLDDLVYPKLPAHGLNLNSLKFLWDRFSLELFPEKNQLLSSNLNEDQKDALKNGYFL